MSEDPIPSASRDHRVDAIIAAYLEAVDGGGTPDRQELLAYGQKTRTKAIIMGDVELSVACAHYLAWNSNPGKLSKGPVLARQTLVQQFGSGSVPIPQRHSSAEGMALRNRSNRCGRVQNRARPKRCWRRVCLNGMARTRGFPLHVRR